MADHTMRERKPNDSISRRDFFGPALRDSISSNHHASRSTPCGECTNIFLSGWSRKDREEFCDTVVSHIVSIAMESPFLFHPPPATSLALVIATVASLKSTTIPMPIFASAARIRRPTAEHRERAKQHRNLTEIQHALQKPLSAQTKIHRSDRRLGVFLRASPDSTTSVRQFRSAKSL